MSKVGFVKRWDEERGFGFIGQEGGQSDIFVHRTCLVGINALNLNDRVLYDAIYDDRKQKFQAISCSLITAGGAGQEQGHALPPMNQWGGHHQPSPIPVQNFMMASPSGMTPMSSPGTPPAMHGMMPPVGFMTPQNQGFVPNNFMPPQHTGSPNQMGGALPPPQASPNGMTPQSGGRGPSPVTNMQQFW